jgi:hypothetical protein
MTTLESRCNDPWRFLHLTQEPTIPAEEHRTSISS